MIEAVVCFIRQNNQTLLMEKLPGPTVVGEHLYNGPGGKVERDEDPYQAVIREVKDETGLKIHKPLHRGVIFVPPHQRNRFNDWMIHVFTATRFSGVLQGSKEGEPKWVDDEAVPGLKRWKSDEIFWPLLESPVKFTLRMIYEGDEYKSHELTTERL